MEEFKLKKIYDYPEDSEPKLEGIEIVFPDWVISFNFHSEVVGIRETGINDNT